MIKAQRGDTIIEVLMAIAIIALALGGGFTLSSRSFHTGIDSVERSEALALSQGQIEFLKNAQINGLNAPYTLDTYKNFAKSNLPSFCIHDTYDSLTDIYVGQPRPYAQCKGVDGTRYEVDITYDAAANVFKLNTNWDAVSGQGTSQLTLYYKAN